MWDPKASAAYLDIGGLFMYQPREGSNDRLFLRQCDPEAFRWKLRNSTTKGIMSLWLDSLPFLLLDRHGKGNMLVLEVLHTTRGHGWVETLWDNATKRVFLPVAGELTGLPPECMMT